MHDGFDAGGANAVPLGVDADLGGSIHGCVEFLLDSWVGLGDQQRDAELRVAHAVLRRTCGHEIAVGQAAFGGENSFRVILIHGDSSIK